MSLEHGSTTAGSAALLFPSVDDQFRVLAQSLLVQCGGKVERAIDYLLAAWQRDETETAKDSLALGSNLEVPSPVGRSGRPNYVCRPSASLSPPAGALP